MRCPAVANRPIVQRRHSLTVRCTSVKGAGFDGQKRTCSITSSILNQKSRPLESRTIVRAGDPDSLDSPSDTAANQGPPTLFWRVFAALCYLVPWIDSISFGREIYRRFRNLLILYLVPGPLAKVYFSSQFAPLIIFFVMFLSIVKNKKLHHFVRFNCMQAIMLDIVVMLMHIVKAYLPAEIKWSVISHFVDMFMWTTCMGTVVYAVFWTLRGYYADIPFVSESVYHQVALSEYA